MSTNNHRTPSFDFCSGIYGFQATSMAVFADEMRKEFLRQGINFNEIAVRIPKFMRIPLIGFVLGAASRYFYYPLKVKLRRKTNFVFVADSANASVYNFLPRKIKLIIFLHGLAYQQDFKVFNVKADLKDWLIHFASRIFKRPGLLNADLIIANSERGKKDFLTFAGNNDQQDLTVAPLGISKQFRRVDTSALRSEFNIPEDTKVILSVAAPDLRKNIDVVIKALENLNNVQYDWAWVHIGGLHSNVQKMITPALKNKSIIIDQVEYSKMPNFYSMADVFVLPTQYDTFGWPPLEAAACGSPVITSDIAPLNVNLRDIALFVQPDDSDQLANYITQVLADSDFSDNLIGKGLAVIDRFSWSNTANIVLQSISKLDTKANPA